MKFCLIIFVFLFSLSAFTEDVFRIEYEKGSKKYDKYSDKELRRRVWELERAVWQLQSRVFQLEGSSHSGGGDMWICKLSPFTRTYSATGASKAVASHKVIQKCTQGEDGGFHCKNPKCER